MAPKDRSFTISEEELRVVLSELIIEDDEYYLVNEFISILDKHRSKILTTYNK